MEAYVIYFPAYKQYICILSSEICIFLSASRNWIFLHEIPQENIKKDLLDYAEYNCQDYNLSDIKL